MAELLVHGQARTLDISALALTRFDDHKAIVEYNVV
jgi:hypothetical protein